jgi:hypothetical protein
VGRWEIARWYLGVQIRNLRTDPWYDLARFPTLLLGWTWSALGILLIVAPLVKGRLPALWVLIPLAIGVLLLVLTGPWPFRRKRREGPAK